MQEQIEFDQWNHQKKQIDYSKEYPHFSTREIWWASLGKNISSETAGKGKDFLRPILIFKKVYGNALLAIPLTTQERKGDYYFPFNDSKGIQQYALLAQIRYLDAKRLKYKKSRIKPNNFNLSMNSFIHLIKNNPDDDRGIRLRRINLHIKNIKKRDKNQIRLLKQNYSNFET